MRVVAPVLLVLVAATAVGCTPTLSRQRGEAHLDAMARAGRHFHHGRLRSAVVQWGIAARTAERRVDRDEARWRRAKALAGLGEHAEALAILDDLAAARPVSRRTVRALYDASRLRIEELGRRAEGITGLRTLVTEHAGHGLAPRALRLVLDDLEQRGDGQGALAFARELYPRVRETELGDNLLWYEARVHAARGDRAGERAILRRLVEAHPYPHGQLWDDALVRLADLAEEDGDARGAIDILEELVSVHEWTYPGTYTLPTFGESQLRIARLYRDALSDSEAAADAFREVVDEFPHSLLRDDALTELGEMRLEEGEVTEGCAILRGVLADFEVGRARRRAERLVGERCSGASGQSSSSSAASTP